MITAAGVTKCFGKVKALDQVSFSMEKGKIYGLVGANGAGKSTLLRILAGVYRQNEGTVEIDGVPVYEHAAAKDQLVFVPDELFFLHGASLKRMAKLYAALYPSFDNGYFQSLAETFQLNMKVSVQSFSKGMKRQAAIILALACRPGYLLLDETFDGLDPIMRNLVKSVVCREVEEHKMAVLLSSHSLRELEGFCDQLAMLYKGGLIFESDITDLQTSLFKIQVAFDYNYDQKLFDQLALLKCTKQGKVSSLIVRGEKEETVAYLKELHPAILEVLPLSLEEVFTYELDALGYVFDPEPAEKEAVQNENQNETVE